MIRNCFSIDVEGFVESNIQSIHIDSKYISRTTENYEIEKNMTTVLELLNELKIKATFFILGRIGRDTPAVVKEAAGLGHEIGCHSNEHLRIYSLSKEHFREDLLTAKKTLEDCSGKDVIGFRAPDFSITRTSLWALDILQEAGFKYDSSICPTGIHDVYGIENSDPYIHVLSNGLVEFPVSTISIAGKRIPFGGGGYFRLYPLFLSRHFTSKVNREGHPCMFYMHPYEIGPIIPKIGEVSAYRRFRHFFNCKKGVNRTREFLNSYQFSTAAEILIEKEFLSQ